MKFEERGRHRMRIFTLFVALLMAGLLMIAGCGTTEKTTPPQESENPFAAAKVGTDTTLEVVTWNLEQFAKAGDATVEYVVQVIEGLDVDLVAMQEIYSRTQFNAVLAGLEGYEGWKASSAGYDINLAFVYRTGGSLTMTSIYEILQDEGREFPRSPLVMEFLFNGKEFVIINNHLKCCGNNVIEENDSWDEETRRRDANLLLEEIIEAQYADKHVIVVGDFNDELDDSSTKNVFQNFIDAPDDWRFVDMPIAEGPAYGWSFPGWPSHLDHILINAHLFDAHQGSEALVQVVPLHNFLNGGWSDFDDNISDHLPVVLRLKP
jgi:endonuclease/exonuclease/phosphatase family metal-dependent hydrolase